MTLDYIATNEKLMIKITDKYAFFFKEWPSNFKSADFEWEYMGEKHKFFCTEQAFMWAKAMKFGDVTTAVKILNADNPMLCKMYGREVENYVEGEWEEARYEIMRDVNLEKYRQNSDLREKLLDPKFDGKTFVEASPYDRIWGVGLAQDDPAIDDEYNWKGRNLLGKAITEVRDILSTGK